MEVESRKVIKQYPEKKKNMDKVKLPEQDEADSDDEWDGFVEATDSGTSKPEIIVKIMQDKNFLAKLNSRLKSSSVQVWL